MLHVPPAPVRIVATPVNEPPFLDAKRETRWSGCPPPTLPCSVTRLPATTVALDVASVMAGPAVVNVTSPPTFVPELLPATSRKW